MDNEPLEFHFYIEDDMNESDIHELWLNTQQCQRQFDDFLKGNCSSDDFCDVLRQFDIDPDYINLIYDHNLRNLGII